MEFSVSKSDLVRELGLTQGVVEKKTTIPILSNILVETDQDQVWLTATDLELGIRCACPARVKKEGAGPFRRDACSTTFGCCRMRTCRLSSPRTSGRAWCAAVPGPALPECLAKAFPELPQMPDVLAEIPLSVLVADDSADDIRHLGRRIALHAEWSAAAAEEQGLVMVATDGHRLAHDRDGRSTSTWLAHLQARCCRKKAMSEILKLASEARPKQIEFSGNENHLFFEIEKRLLLSRKLTGNFPDYERVLPKEHPHTSSLRARRAESSASNVSRNFRTSVRGRSVCNCCRAR